MSRESIREEKNFLQTKLSYNLYKLMIIWSNLGFYLLKQPTVYQKQPVNRLKDGSTVCRTINLFQTLLMGLYGICCSRFGFHLGLLSEKQQKENVEGNKV